MLRTAVVLTVCSALVSGCGSQPPQKVSRTEAQLRQLGTLYGKYLAQNNGKAPANEEQFEEFLNSEQPRTENQDTGLADTLLRSPNDGQVLVVRYGKLTGPASPNGYPWIGYIQTELDGTFKLISARGELKEVDQRELDEFFSSDH